MHELLPILRQVFPSVTSYDSVATVVQANAEGHRVICNDERKTDVFVKQVEATKYATKSWPDFRRTLMYLRTEVHFYKEILPDLRKRGFHATPIIFYSDCHLEGLIEDHEKATDQSVPEPLNWSSEGKGGTIIMESIGDTYFQDAPISLEQAKHTLSAIAALHASAWEDTELLQKSEKWLSRGSYHLRTRNVKELAGIEQAWEHFSSNFHELNPALFERTADIGSRIKNLAEYISEEVSPGPNDSYATLSHGDFKSMNCFLPKVDSEDAWNRGVVLVDFASTGVGLGMSDVAMHIHHTVLPELLDGGGEEELLHHYLNILDDLLGPTHSYPRDIALRHYRLAVADYFRFFLGRFWKSSTPDSFAAKKGSKNTALINRNTDSALRFLDRVDGYLKQIENEKATEARAAE